jgi:hypothetical protein
MLLRNKKIFCSPIPFYRGSLTCSKSSLTDHSFAQVVAVEQVMDEVDDVNDQELRKLEDKLKLRREDDQDGQKEKDDDGK